MGNMAKESYQFSKRTDKDVELERLKFQAKIKQTDELELLISHGLRCDMRVLDAACGPGEMTRMIGSFVDRGEVIGIDINEELLTAAKQHLGPEANIAFYPGDVYRLPFENHFDFIYCRFLFQHLSHPHVALASLHKALKPNGVLCIMDIDDHWLSITPTSNSFEKLRTTYCDFQAANGGDRHVGTKLPYYLRKYDFKEVQTSMMTLTSDQIGWRAFIQLTMGFRVQPLVQQGLTEITASYQELCQYGEDKDAFGMIGTFIVSGKKEIAYGR